MKKYVALLRGINVGGHHKVPMIVLKKALEELGFENTVTLLNSGNVIFDAPSQNPDELEELIGEHLASTFGFPIPTIVRESGVFTQLIKDAPFQLIEIHKDIRLYVSFLKKDSSVELALPWKSTDGSFEILEKKAMTIISVLNLSKAKTPKAMEIVEKTYGKDITTRNWKTIERIAGKV
jgi:uncharacterized protein (DUF1697 family)